MQVSLPQAIKSPKQILQLPKSKLASFSNTWNQNKHNVLNTSSFVDSIFRGMFRYLESAYFSNPMIRVPFRFATEILRYTTDSSVQLLIDKKAITNEVWHSSLRKVVENTAATIFFEPNQYNNRFARIGIGFVNMFTRFASRVGMIFWGLLNPGSVEAQNIADEFLGRSLGRFIYTDSDNQLLGIGTRALEQLTINSWLNIMPLKQFLDKKFKFKK